MQEHGFVVGRAGLSFYGGARENRKRVIILFMAHARARMYVQAARR